MNDADECTCQQLQLLARKWRLVHEQIMNANVVKHCCYIINCVFIGEAVFVDQNCTLKYPKTCTQLHYVYYYVLDSVTIFSAYYSFQSR